MITADTLRKVKFGAKLTFANGIYAIFLGIFYLFLTEFILKINFKMLGSSWGFFDRYNAELGALFSRLFILVGIIIIAMGIAIIYLSYCILKKKAKDLWVVLFIIGVIFWSGLTAIEACNMNIYTIGTSLFGLISFLIGMTIPLRYYLHSTED